jgi:hypothetical protein
VYVYHVPLFCFFCVHSSDAQNLPGTAPVSVVTNTEDNRPKGTTWVFSDGSQVLSSSVTDTMDEHQGKGGGKNMFIIID